ncbi:phosphoribosyltransferase [Demequina sp. SO4-13]|uniref:phosphoribosyltransferase n=1 Tax=Demequina sp. SO4-13 TaxID=3401027 RepID=UPI003AF4B933
MGLTWREVVHSIRDLDVSLDDVVLAGSVPLLAHGVLTQVGDIDLVARGSAWEALAGRGDVTAGEMGDRYVDLAGKVQVFSGWRGEPADAIVARSARVDGIRVASLTDVVAYKRRLGRHKDEEHLAALKRWADEMTDPAVTARRPTTVLADRAAAGERLAPVLSALAPARPAVLALPRGGVPVAAPIARALGASLDVLVVRKLGLPSNPDYAFGAIGEGGDPLVDERIVAAADLLESEVAAVVAAERRELARRVALYRGDGPALSLYGRTAIVVDDGAATGSTAQAAIAVARALGAADVIVAVGTAPPDVLAMLGRHADRAVAAMTPEPFLSVGQWYRDFTPIDDGDVLTILRDAS